MLNTLIYTLAPHHRTLFFSSDQKMCLPHSQDCPAVRFLSSKNIFLDTVLQICRLPKAIRTFLLYSTLRKP